MRKARSLAMIAGLVLAVFLIMAPHPRAQTAVTDPADVVFWQSVQSSSDPAEYQSYLDAFPNGRFVALARARMARLQPAGGANGGGTPPITIPGMTADPRPASAPQ